MFVRTEGSTLIGRAFVFGVFLFVLMLAHAQQNGLPDLDAMEHGPPPDSSQGLVRLDVEVKDASGKPITGLTPQDFSLSDNQQPHNIVSLQQMNASSAATNHSLEVILVLDEINLQGVQLRDEEKEAELFLRQHEGHLAQPVMVYRVTTDGPLISGPPSLDGNLLADQIAHRKQSIRLWRNVEDVFLTPEVSGRSSLGLPVGTKIANLDATRSLGSLATIAIEERRRPGRKLLFWLSSGWKAKGAAAPGIFSIYTELSTRLREARIALYETTQWAAYNDGVTAPSDDFADPVYLTGMPPDSRDYGYMALPVLAAQSGGGALKASSNISDLISRRVEQGKHFYLLTFDPPRTGQVDEYHQLRVQVNQSGADAVTWTGYFDQPAFYDQPNTNVESITVKALGDLLQASTTVSDSQLAERLARLELTERLSRARLAELEADLRGKKAKQALEALGDQSAFLDPPAAEVIAIAGPSAETQQQLIARAVQYVDRTLPGLPRFQAERTTTLYQQNTPAEKQTWKTASGDQSLHQGETFKATVLFRDGREVVTGKQPKGAKAAKVSLVGTFGPILGIVIKGATAPTSELKWARWQQGQNGREAVFQYHAHPREPLYSTGTEYLARDDTTIPFLLNVSFHGELAIDPDSGAILRLTMQADLPPRLPLDRSDVMVEYGPVKLGDRTYMCPLRCVSISRQRGIKGIHAWGEDYGVYGPFETVLSNMDFDQYRLFQPTVRILPGFTPESKD